MNVHCPAIVADSYRESRIVSFSTGNVYPSVPLGTMTDWVADWVANDRPASTNQPNMRRAMAASDELVTAELGPADIDAGRCFPTPPGGTRFPPTGTIS
jgi:hypothetical protein